MIANTLILPTEKPTDLDDIKRALLTYDKIYIASPDDREMIPPNTYQNVLNMSLGFPTMPINFSTGPIKPLGKIDNYEDIFEKILKECNTAIKQGSVEILQAPEYNNGFTIGATPIPNDTPDPLLTYLNYRNISESEEFMKLMSLGLGNFQFNKIKDISILAPTGREDTEQSINDIKRPSKAKLNLQDENEVNNEILSKMCHNRTGALVKYLGFCFLKDLHPFTSDSGYANVISKLEYNFIGSLGQIESNEELLIKQKRLSSLHSLILNEFVEPSIINSLSVKQILELRTKAWGRTQENRALFIAEINEIAEEAETAKKFERIARARIKGYLKVAGEYQHEVNKLKIMLLLDANLFLLFKGGEYQLIEKILKAPSLDALLIIGSASIAYLKQHASTVLDIIKKAENKRETTGYAIYTNYKYIM